MMTMSILAMVIYLFGGFADSPNQQLASAAKMLCRRLTNSKHH